MADFNEVTPRGIHLSFPDGLGVFNEDGGYRFGLLVWWWSALLRKDYSPNCGCSSCHCSLLTLHEFHDEKYVCMNSFMGSDGLEDSITTEMKNTARSKDFGTIRVYFREVLRQHTSQPEGAAQSRNAKLILQTLHESLQQAVLNGNDDDIVEPDFVVKHLVARFQEVWPEEWKRAETLWKDHIHLLWDKLRKRLHLLPLFKKLRVRANERLYRPGTERHRECMERLHTMQQKLSYCQQCSSSSESSDYRKYRKEKKRKRDHDEGDEGDGDGEIPISQSVKHRKIFIGTSPILLPIQTLATDHKFHAWQSKQWRAGITMLGGGPESFQCSCDWEARKRIWSYEPQFRSS